jgi:tRNA G18 (ribose-2'-O)-methylase SpoU
MGNEGFGLRTNIKARCDGLVHLTASKRPPIPARVPSDHPNAVAADAAAALRANDVSLNVTSAASALLARWQSQVVDGMDGW